MKPKTSPFIAPDGTPIVSLSEEEFHLALDCLEPAFPDARRGFFHAVVLRDPLYDPRYSLAVRHGKRVLSFLQIFRRSFRIDGRLISFGGIGSVGTHPESRGRGYARALLLRAIELMREDRLAGSLLFTGIHPFYEALGWRTLERRECEIAVSRLKPLRSRATTRPLREADIPALTPLFERTQAHAALAMPRDEAYWRARSSWMNHPAWTVWRGDALIGYFYACQYKPERPVLHITEYGACDDAPDVQCDLLGLMAEKAEAMKCSAIRAFFQSTPAMKRFLQENDWVDSWHPHRYMMWLDLGEESIFERIQRAIDDDSLLFWTTDAF